MVIVYDAQPPCGRFSRAIIVSASTIIGLIVFLTINNHLSSKPDADTTTSLLRQHRRGLLFSLKDNDYKTVTPREGRPLKEVVDDGEPQQQYEESPLFIVPEAQLAATKHAAPTVIRNRLPPRGSTVVDILSIGSKTRPEYVSDVYYAVSTGRILFTTLDTRKLLAFCFVFSAYCTKGYMGQS